MINGPCPSCSVCHGPFASLTYVGMYATTKATAIAPREINRKLLLRSRTAMAGPSTDPGFIEPTDIPDTPHPETRGHGLQRGSAVAAGFQPEPRSMSILR